MHTVLSVFNPPSKFPASYPSYYPKPDGFTQYNKKTKPKTKNLTKTTHKTYKQFIKTFQPCIGLQFKIWSQFAIMNIIALKNKKTNTNTNSCGHYCCKAILQL